VATTNSRRVAENLGLTPGTASRALGRLRSLGFVDYARQSGKAGRFGPSAYVLGALPGIAHTAENRRPRPAQSSSAEPRSAEPRSAEPRSAEPRAAEPRAAEANRAEPAQRRKASRSQSGGGQLALLSLERSES